MLCMCAFMCVCVCAFMCVLCACVCVVRVCTCICMHIQCMHMLRIGERDRVCNGPLERIVPLNHKPATKEFGGEVKNTK